MHAQHRDQKYRHERKLSRHAERAGDDQRRQRRDRQPDLLDEHVDEHQQQAVLAEQRIEVERHVGSRRARAVEGCAAIIADAARPSLAARDAPRVR